MSLNMNEFELLITVYDEVMLSIVRSMLEEDEIPYHVQERNGSALGMITGFSLYGADVYVPTDALDTAKALVAGLEDAEITFVDDEGNEISVEEAAEETSEETSEGTSESEDD